jgi:hypothetical protein
MSVLQVLIIFFYLPKERSSYSHFASNETSVRSQKRWKIFNCRQAVNTPLEQCILFTRRNGLWTFKRTHRHITSCISPYKCDKSACSFSLHSTSNQLHGTFLLEALIILHSGIKNFPPLFIVLSRAILWPFVTLLTRVLFYGDDIVGCRSTHCRPSATTT